MPRVATPGRVRLPAGLPGTPASLFSLAAAFECCKKRASTADCLTASRVGLARVRVGSNEKGEPVAWPCQRSSQTICRRKGYQIVNLAGMKHAESIT